MPSMTCHSDPLCVWFIACAIAHAFAALLVPNVMSSAQPATQNVRLTQLQWCCTVASPCRKACTLTHHDMQGRTTMSTQAENDVFKFALSASCHCTQGTKKMYRKPLFRGNSTADPDDIRSPHFDDCAVPLVWWPWWPENPSDFFLTSVAPFHAMLHGGVIDKNIKYTPVMEGLKQPGYFQWYSDPITNFPVSFLHCLGG